MLAVLKRIVDIVLGLVFGVLALFGALSGIALVGKFQEGYVFLGPIIGIGMFLVSIAVLKVCWDNIRGRGEDDKRLYPECLFTVTLSDTHIQVTDPNGRVSKLALADLSEVSIVTNSSGPWGMDVWWRLSGSDENSGCAFPGGATGEETILQWTNTLENFDSEMFVKAMCCTSEARFVCWSRAA